MQSLKCPSRHTVALLPVSAGGVRSGVAEFDTRVVGRGSDSSDVELGGQSRSQTGHNA